MRNFFGGQGRIRRHPDKRAMAGQARVSSEAYGFGTQQVETRGERSPSEKEPFLI
jgi:hypothetical protein